MGPQQVAAFRRKMAKSDLFLGPHENTRAQVIRLNELFHEAHLVDAYFQEETRESGKQLFLHSSFLRRNNVFIAQKKPFFDA